MITLKGFITRKTLIDNTPGTIATIGELSTYSLSFSKDTQVYESYSYTSSDLYIATYKNQEQTLTIDATVAELVLGIGDAIYTYGETNSNFSKDVMAASVTNSYVNDIKDFTIGDLVTYKGVTVPEWIAFTILGNEDVFVRVWLSDNAYRIDYDEYEIVVVTPLDNVDDFYGDYATVTNVLSNISEMERMDRIQTYRGFYPETALRTYSYEYIDPNNPSNRYLTHWTAIIYGPQGDYPDIIKRAFVDYVLARSNHTKSEWVPLLPDLFRSTQFYVFPRWDRVAVSGINTFDVAYSSIVDNKEINSYITTRIPFVPVDDIKLYTNVISHPFKYLQLYMVGSNTNVAGKKEFKEVFPDYIPIQTTSLDFNRMSQFTQGWSLLLENALISAENLGRYDTPPKEFRKVIINNRLYITYTYENIEFYILVKSESSEVI